MDTLQISPRVVLGAESLSRGASGIGRVARLTGRAIADHSRRGRLTARALAFRSSAADLGLLARSASGSRARYVAEIHLASLTASHFVYDFAGMARAHPRMFPLRRPYLLWIHGIEIWEDATPAWLDRARAARVLIANSRYTKQRASKLHSGLDAAQVCWLATEENEPPIRRPTSRPANVTILSRIDAAGGYKGHRELIDAWPRVVAASPNSRLLIAGDGPGMSVVKQWVATSSVRSHIDLLGFVAEADLASLWQRTSVFAMPSRGEGFGIAYIEAMRHGIPVVASVHDAAPEINLHGETGYNVDLNTSNALADALLEALERAVDLGNAGQERWYNHFRYECFRARFEPLLDELLSEH